MDSSVYLLWRLLAHFLLVLIDVTLLLRKFDCRVRHDADENQCDGEDDDRKHDQKPVLDKELVIGHLFNEYLLLSRCSYVYVSRKVFGFKMRKRCDYCG